MSAVTIAFHVSKVASTVQDVFTSPRKKAYYREQERLYSQERVERLAELEAIFAIRNSKENSGRQDGCGALEASEECAGRIACVRESPLLSCIPGKISSFLDGSDDSHSCLALNRSSKSTSKGPTLIQIGPLPEGWFIEPSALEIKFNHLTCKGYCSDRDVHVIAYDKTAERCIYVEFPTHIDAASFIDKWTASQPDGFEDVSVQIMESLF